MSGIRLHEEDKGKLLRAGFLLSMVALTVLFIFIRRTFPVVFVIAALVLVQQFWLIPSISQKYRQILDHEDNLARYIPLWNNSRNFSPVMEKVTLVISIIQGFLVLLSAMPFIAPGVLPPITSAIFGEEISMNFTFYAIMYSLVVYVILNIVTGLGYIGVKQNVDQVYIRSFGKLVWTTIDRVQYLLFFFPIVRVYAYILLWDRLRKMCMVQNLGQIDTDLEDEEEEEYLNVN